MSIIDNNKLLAEFLGWHSKKINVTASRPKGDGIEMYLKEVTEYNREFTEDELKFYTDWYWIMRVVEKIEGLGFIFKLTTGSSTFLKKNEVLIWNDEFRGDSKIQATYNACVEFVKLYNNQEI